MKMKETNNSVNKNHCLVAKTEKQPIHAGCFSQDLRSTEQPSYAMILTSDINFKE